MAIEIEIRTDGPLLAGVLEFALVRLGSASEQLRQDCQDLVARVVAAGKTDEGGSAFLRNDRRSAVRRLLKGGGFSPTGRNRPAHELLLNLVLEREEFPHISNAVDVNNLMSMESLFPISMLDAAKLGGRVVLRWGRAGEGFVFNQSGHWLDLNRCLLLANASDVPLGSPIKDSMDGKVFDACSGLFAVIYASSELITASELKLLLQRFAALLQRETGGRLEQCCVVDAPR